MDIGNVKIQSVNKDFSEYIFTGYTIEIERKTGDNKTLSLNINQWNTLNKIANICLN
jgi:hypothetical protein